ncbi:MAG: hypothetical protein R3E01_33150 [Pirellulaceae bacterium]|nr:hypothetical protein [Planctomycetales bacterium]
MNHDEQNTLGFLVWIVLGIAIALHAGDYIDRRTIKRLFLDTFHIRLPVDIPNRPR